MLGPKKHGTQRVLQQRGKAPGRHCLNCGAKITNDNLKYCDRVCANEHAIILKAERRPKEIACSACGASLDPLTREPGEWARTEYHFCDGICAAAWKQANGRYAEMSAKGNVAIKEYKVKHGRMHNHENRVKAVSVNNTTKPPRAKMTRTGNVWGYEAHILPNGERTGYIGHIPELTGLVGYVEAKTAKEALKLLRARFLEIRARERTGGIRQEE